ncbi:MAG: BMC domain-containing protein [bacterium]|nr:BMC domain-containing protein [bacterium]
MDAEGKRLMPSPVNVLETKIIQRPSSRIIEMLSARMEPKSREQIISRTWDAIGLVMHNLPALFAYADIAEKAAAVTVAEIRGICPQHFAMLAIFGDTASVETAINAIQKQSTDEKTWK